MRVKLATVGFQTGTLVLLNVPEYASYFITTRLLDVITSMDLTDVKEISNQSVTYSMKISAIMFMPKNIQMSQNRYMTARNGRDIVVIPGKKTKLQQKHLID